MHHFGARWLHFQPAPPKVHPMVPREVHAHGCSQLWKRARSEFPDLGVWPLGPRHRPHTKGPLLLVDPGGSLHAVFSCMPFAMNKAHLFPCSCVSVSRKGRLSAHAHLCAGLPASKPTDMCMDVHLPSHDLGMPLGMGIAGTHKFQQVCT